MKMARLERCPACHGQDVVAVHAHNDLSEISAADPKIGPELRHSDYMICRQCHMVFAQWRQTGDEFDRYYELFAEYEHRSYAVDPPPAPYLAAKARRADSALQVMEKHNVVRPGMKVLHLRSEAGELLSRLRDRHGITELYGLEYFDSNIRYTRGHHKLPHIEKFSPGHLKIPFAPKAYDLIVANHILTHALDPRRYLEDLRAYLAPGGAIYAYGEVDHEIAFRMGMEFSKLGINNFHKQLLTPRNAQNLLRLSGYDSEIVQRIAPFYFEMLIRPAAALAPEALPPEPVEPMVRAIRRWARLHMVERVRRRVEERLPRATDLARTLVRHARSIVGRG